MSRKNKVQHPFIEMGLKIGDEVWVRAKIVELSKPNTMGWANGMLIATAVTHGLNQDPGDPQRICTDVRNIRKDAKR